MSFRFSARAFLCAAAITSAHPEMLAAATTGPLARIAHLKSDNIDVSDSFGEAVAIAGDTVVVGAPGEDSAATGVNGDQDNNSANSSGAVYVLGKNAGIWSQQAYLKASNTGSEDRFGSAVAISGDTMVIGAPFEDSAATGVNGNQADISSSGSGAAYVFTRSGGVWTQQAYLKASNTGSGDQFGRTVAISGDLIVVGAVFEDSSAPGVNGNQANDSALEAGAAYVFRRNGTTWSQEAYLKAGNAAANDFFGWSVAVSGETVVVGAPGEDSNATGVNGDPASRTVPDSGAVYVFTATGGTWTQQAYLKAASGSAGDTFGHAVAISGNTIAAGAPNEDSQATGADGNQGDESAFNAGAAYVFTRSGGTWAQEAYLKSFEFSAGDFLGSAVAISGDRVTLGAPESGRAYVYLRGGSTWAPAGYLQPAQASTKFGSAVAVDGKRSVAGAPWEDNPTSSGATYVFGEAPVMTLRDGALATDPVIGDPSSYFDNWFALPVAGESSRRSFRFENSGAEDLVVSGFSLVSRTPGLFTLVNAPTFIPPGGHAVMHVDFFSAQPVKDSSFVVDFVTNDPQRLSASIGGRADARPMNDTFAERINLGANVGATATGTLAGAYSEAADGEPDLPVMQPLDGHPLGFGGDFTVWYQWTAPAGAKQATLTLEGPEPATVLSVYTGTELDGLKRVLRNHRSRADSVNRTTFAVTPGTTYLIRAAVWGDDYAAVWQPNPTPGLDFSLRLAALDRPITPATRKLGSRFDAADSDRDSFLSLAEFQAVQNKRSSVALGLFRFKQADADQDDLVSLEEFQASGGGITGGNPSKAQLFDLADADHNTVLHPTEYLDTLPSGTPFEKAIKSFFKRDKDDNSLLSRKEFGIKGESAALASP